MDSLRIDLRLALPDDVQHLAIGDRPVHIRCIDPAHGPKDKQHSMAVYADHVKCYGCPLHLGCPGDCWEGVHSANCQQWQLQALAALLHITPEEAAQAAEKYTPERLDAYRERAATDARRDPLPMALAEAYRSLLHGPRADRKEWLYKRGLYGDEAIWTGCLGHNGFQFTIPVFAANGDLLTIRFRRDDQYGTKRPKYMGMPGRNGLYLYPENRVAADQHRWIVLTEGELDALLFWQHNIPAVSATNGAGQASKVPALLKAVRPDLTHILIATDQDEPGDAAAEQTRLAAESLGFQTKRITWPREFKDVSEYCAGAPEQFRQQFLAR